MSSLYRCLVGVALGLVLNIRKFRSLSCHVLLHAQSRSIGRRVEATKVDKVRVGWSVGGCTSGRSHSVDKPSKLQAQHARGCTRHIFLDGTHVHLLLLFPHGYIGRIYDQSTSIILFNDHFAPTTPISRKSDLHSCLQCD